jgi:hypothetical protein
MFCSTFFLHCTGRTKHLSNIIWCPNYVRLMFCLTFLCTEKRPILQLLNIIKTIVELSIVEHPNSCHLKYLLYLDANYAIHTTGRKKIDYIFKKQLQRKYQDPPPPRDLLTLSMWNSFKEGLGLSKRII